MILDGASNTLVLSETFIIGEAVEALAGCNTGLRGWSDGWGSGIVRAAGPGPIHDRSLTIPQMVELSWCYWVGSSHQAGVNGVFADGSVRTISYSIKTDIFNNMADRQDGNVIPEF